MSFTIPKDTMSRVKPGYATFFNRSRISWGVGTALALTNHLPHLQGRHCLVAQRTGRHPSNASESQKRHADGEERCGTWVAWVLRSDAIGRSTEGWWTSAARGTDHPGLA